MPVSNHKLSPQPAMLALAAGLLPLITVQVCYLISVKAGHVPACFPYLDGCTSISRAARHGDALFLFRAVIISSAVLIIAYWLLLRAWLQQLEPDAGRSYRTLVVLGIVGALFLILYADFLGSEGNAYRFMRRYGIIIFFGFTPIAQLLQVHYLQQLNASRSRPIKPRVVTAQFVLGCIMFGCGIGSVTLDWLGLKTDAIANALEWNFALCIFLFFALSAAYWRNNFYLMTGIGTEKEGANQGSAPINKEQQSS